MTESLAGWIAGSENEQFTENLLFCLLQESGFRKEFAKWLGYSTNITRVGKQRRDCDQRHDLVLYRKNGTPINVELKGCSGFTTAQRRALNGKRNTSKIHRIICPQPRKQALLEYIPDQRTTKIKTWAGLATRFKQSKYSLILEGIEQYLLSGETLSKRQLEEDIRRYRGSGSGRTWYETYAFVNHLTSLLMENTKKTYVAGWSYSNSSIGRYLRREYRRESAYLFVGFYFEGDELHFLIQTNQKNIARRDLEEWEHCWGKYLWSNDEGSPEHIHAEDCRKRISKYVQRLERWKGEE